MGLISIVLAGLIFWLSDKSSKEQQIKIETLFQVQDSLIIHTINNSVKMVTVYVDLSNTPATTKVDIHSTATK